MPQENILYFHSVEIVSKPYLSIVEYAFSVNLFRLILTFKYLK